MQGTKIQGSIVGKGLFEKFHNVMHEGKTYFISNFEVIDNAKEYRATPHAFRLLFSAATFVREQSVDFPVKHFDFVPLDEIANANESSYPNYFVGWMPLLLAMCLVV